jgi:NAD(P)-dependent dehydrogenase (short-subunit alcohol dehydrogenase family)
MRSEPVAGVEDLFSVRDRVAVVTGGSRGIGLMIARGLVEAGARVYISARKADVCDEAAGELMKIGECISIPADLSTAEGIERLVGGVSKHETQLHILVNNAGATWGAPMEDYPESGFDKVMTLNVKTVFYLTTRFLPLLRRAASKDNPARVINIGSVDGIKVPVTETFAYSASKAAVHMLTRHLAHHLVNESILVNAIAPGLFPTKMTEFMFDAGEDAVASNIPMGRVGRAEDAAGAALFLASKAGAYLMGAIIPVDGGESTR